MRTFFQNLSLKFKLFLTYALISLIIFTLSFALLFYNTKKNLKHRIQEELNKSNQTITDMVETTAKVSIKNHLRAIAEKNREIIQLFHQSYLSGNISREQAREKAIQVMQSQSVGETGYIYCIDSHGKAVVHPKSGVLGSDLSQWKFIQTQISAKEGYLEYHWQNPDDQKVRAKALYMTYFQPWDWIISVSSYKSEFSKLVTVDDFKKRILGLTFGKTGYSFIFDTKGNSLIHPELRDNILNIKGEEGLPIVREMIRQKKGFLTYYWKNPSESQARKKFVAFDSIPQFNWIIASSSYTKEVFSPLYEMQKTFLLILLLAISISAIAALALGMSITRPLTAFVRRFEKGAQGDWTSKMDTLTNDELGQLSRSFNVFIDKLDTYRRELISEIGMRRQTELELDSLKNYLSSIIDSMPSTLIGVDSQNIVTLWNEKAREISAIPREEAVGTKISTLLPHFKTHLPRIGESLKTGRTQYIMKAAFATGNGQKRFEDITVYPLITQGLKGAVIRIDDVTEKIRMEETLIQNEKMLSVGALAAGMAHEINNPLAGVIQNTQVLNNRLGDPTIPANVKAAKEAGTDIETIQQFMTLRKIPRILQSITDSGMSITSIVDNMLNFARKGDSSFSTHDMAQLMDKSLELAKTNYDLKKQYDFKSIVIKKEYEKDLPFILCEAGKIQQVLLNILTNGAQAMYATCGIDQKDYHHEPQFTLRIKKEASCKMLRMEIEDNGPGIDPSILKRIFEPFFTTKPVGVGTGLGLSVSYFIVTENHGGTMDVISEIDKGSTFIIRLPCMKSGRRS
ncbi:MAG: PAS domain S-box protein [Desulfobulbaceae bacterium]|nr:PAS domain S-box protein [Desulfobulbaceae bacterium]